MLRFRDSFEKRSVTECWPWLKLKRGHMQYGVLYVDKEHRSVAAHRFSLIHKLGRNLAPGEQALHTCDNSACVNPDHLYVGTHADNMRDKVARGRTYNGDQRGERNGAAKLSGVQVAQIRALIGTGPTQREIAKQFGVSAATVSEIKNRRHWK